MTGSAGHLGEALSRVLRERGHDVTGIDLKASPYTTAVGSVADRGIVRECIAGADAVLHAATLHKPHVGSHSKQEFVDANVTGTLTLLEEAVAAGVRGLVFTSSTSAFGRALTPAPGQPAAWITSALSIPTEVWRYWPSRYSRIRSISDSVNAEVRIATTLMPWRFCSW